jgi:hypothetical protein
MPGRFPILGAFIIVNEGRLLDVGMIERVSDRPCLYRLPTEGVGNTREHLGLLFLLFHLYGESKSVVQARKEEENYLIYPNDCEDQVHNSQNFPGLVRYIKRYFPQKQKGKAKYSTQAASLFIENFGQYEIFDGKAFNKLFRARRLKHPDFGIIQTGIIEPDEMLIFDVELKNLSEIYEALQTFDRVRLEQFCVENKKAEELVNVLQTAIRIHGVSGNIIDPNNFDIGYGSISINKCDKKISPLAVHDRIQAMIDEILQVNDLLIPDGWNEKVESLKYLVKRKLFANIPLCKYESPSISTLLFKSLQNLKNDSSDAELLLIIYYLYFSDYNMAVAESSKYCQKYENDDFGWFLKGKSLLFIKQNKQARESFEKSLRLGQQVAARLGIAFTYNPLTDKEVIWDWINRAYEIDPDNVSVLAYKAKWLDKWGDPHDALELIDTVLDKLPEPISFRIVKISCLYNLGMYDKVISEIMTIKAIGRKPLRWIDYLLVASLYAKKKYSTAKEKAQKALPLVYDEQEKGYLHIILRKIAIQEKYVREAVYHSIAMCRLIPERQTSWLWLAADLEWVGHSGLAEGFWDFDIDFTKLDQDEIADTLLLYTLFEKWDKAVKCAFLLTSTSDILFIYQNVPFVKIKKLFLLINFLFTQNVIENNFENWEKPYQIIKRWHEVIPDNEAIKFLHLNQIAQLARRVDSKSFPAWKEEWTRINFDRINASLKGALIWRLYTCWSSGTKFPGIGGVIWPCGIKTTDELSSNLSTKNEFEIFIVIVLIAAMVGFGHYSNLQPLVRKLSFKLEDINPDSNKGIFNAISYLIFQLLKYEQAEIAKTFYSPILVLLKRSQDKNNQRELAISASSICIVISALDEGNYGNYQSIDELEREIFKLKDDDEFLDSLSSAIINCNVAKFLWLCNQPEHTVFSLGSQVDETVNFFQDNIENQKLKDYCICNYLGLIATIASDFFHENFAEEMIRKLDRLYGTSDALARYIAYCKRKVARYKEPGRVKYTKFIKIDEVFEEEKINFIDRLMVDMGIVDQF